MKTLAKHVLKLVVLALSFIITNCEKDDVIKPDDVSENRLTINIISRDHFKNENTRVADHVTNYTKSGRANQRTDASTDDFYINESQVQIIEQEHYTTYTFFVYRNVDTENSLENYRYLTF